MNTISNGLTLIIFTMIALIQPFRGYAQLENVIVETYYISDADDATDTLGGQLPEGSVTYRIFVDLAPGTKLISVYGDALHPLQISSTSHFFNHREEGVSFGKDINRNRYETGTVGLDSYLTLGQVSRPLSQSAYMGVPKSNDSDGSVIGGINNDGGSAEITAGLLKNENTDAGIPLTLADGMVISQRIASAWIDVGFIDIIADEDTTVFGQEGKTTFISQQASLQNNGTQGPDTTTNIVLLAQLTTSGDLHFAINIEVAFVDNGTPVQIRYVAYNENLQPDEVFAPLLNYPYACGCTDPNYLEASTGFACTDNSKCLTPVIFGCTDSLACNYHPDANFNIQEMCCYIGFCQDRDLSLVCPDLEPRLEDRQVIHLAPNPVSDYLTLSFAFEPHVMFPFSVFNSTGQEVMQGTINDDYTINVLPLAPGLYILRLHDIARSSPVTFYKQ